MKVKKQIFFVFTCAVIEVVNKDHQQKGNTYDPGHDGSGSTLSQKVRMIVHERRKADNYIHTLTVYLHLGLRDLI